MNEHVHAGRDALAELNRHRLVPPSPALKAAGIREKIKVMIGGAPVTQEFANEIGADGYSENANSAVALARRLIASV